MVMKYLKIHIIIILSVFIANSCTDHFEKINTDPLSLTAEKVDVSLIGLAFAQAEYNTVNGGPFWFLVSENMFADLYCQYFAVILPDRDTDRYIQTGKVRRWAWNNFYVKAAPNIKLVEDAALKNGLEIQNAIAKVWKVFAYHRITDYWGPVVYSEFGNGQNTVPYDQQESIYRNFFTTLDEAVIVLKANAGGNGFGNHDLIYAGDVNQWIKFAGSLRLRLAIRIIYVDATLAKEQAEKAVSEGVIELNANNAMVDTYADSPNPINTITNWGEYRMSSAMESVLKGFDDPRMPEYFSPAASGDQDGDGIPYEGLRNGQANIDMVPQLKVDYSDVGQRYRPEASTQYWPIPVMRAAETFFLRAEGALEDWDMKGTARELYEEGIRMSIKEFTSVDDNVINAYITSTNTPVSPDTIWDTPAMSDIPVAFDTGGDKDRQLEQIITQKWLALYPDGWEAWAELRRTGYPRLYSRLNSDDPTIPPDEIMRRMTYIDTEFDTNREAVEVAIASPEIAGKDHGLTKVWWDKK